MIFKVFCLLFVGALCHEHEARASAASVASSKDDIEETLLDAVVESSSHADLLETKAWEIDCPKCLVQAMNAAEFTGMTMVSLFTCMAQNCHCEALGSCSELLEGMLKLKKYAVLADRVIGIIDVLDDPCGFAEGLGASECASEVASACAACVLTPQPWCLATCSSGMVCCAKEAIEGAIERGCTNEEGDCCMDDCDPPNQCNPQQWDYWRCRANMCRVYVCGCLKQQWFKFCGPNACIGDDDQAAICPAMYLRWYNCMSSCYNPYYAASAIEEGAKGDPLISSASEYEEESMEFGQKEPEFGVGIGLDAGSGSGGSAWCGTLYNSPCYGSYTWDSHDCVKKNLYAQFGFYGPSGQGGCNAPTTYYDSSDGGYRGRIAWMSNDPEPDCSDVFQHYHSYSNAAPTDTDHISDYTMDEWMHVVNSNEEERFCSQGTSVVWSATYAGGRSANIFIARYMLAPFMMAYQQQHGFGGSVGYIPDFVTTTGGRRLLETGRTPPTNTGSVELTAPAQLPFETSLETQYCDSSGCCANNQNCFWGGDTCTPFDIQKLHACYDGIQV